MWALLLLLSLLLRRLLLLGLVMVTGLGLSL